ncbi:glycerophosphodiester phosphodiesterase family protein [Actibacterium lipolyticum]|uniref:Cytoplasmic glycerophosphodiester phosphodiesterase n=1 Tax=Actibacterium lipolyticum TaxID=1524263 RepID=A0A238JJ94_9RHOB|nr:glycerophosphodiester phosphodiesterase family protein [Actibacterium lipolyticum]SMX30729.1 cytoplasmic glycerophosphodiester phosphodiesterase [Actibacterium lipolyticum]
MTALPNALLTTPLAHRAFHDKAQGRPENSIAAIRAAVAAGYGIEIDVQPSADGVAMVFHDYDLGRLTAHKGPIRQRSAAELAQIGLLGGNEAVPTLAAVLAEVAGHVPLLIEIKDQDGVMGPNVGALEDAVADDLKAYQGDVALMSFNPHSVFALAKSAPNRPRGITTCGYHAEDWPLLPEPTRAKLRTIPDYRDVGASFISHGWQDLKDPRVAELKSAGAKVLCWTIRSTSDEATARQVADNITFEGYKAALP